MPRRDGTARCANGTCRRAEEPRCHPARAIVRGSSRREAWISETRWRALRRTLAPPRPKQIGSTGWVWLILLLVVVVTGCFWLRVDAAPLDRFDAAITDAVVSFRTGWLDALARHDATAARRCFQQCLALMPGDTAAANLLKSCA